MDKECFPTCPKVKLQTAIYLTLFSLKRKKKERKKQIFS